MNTNDSRFHKLRRQLDEFKYTQTLHPDSVELVERLLKDQLRALGDLDKERKKVQSQANKANSPSLAMMEDQIAHLMSRNKEL